MKMLFTFVCIAGLFVPETHSADIDTLFQQSCLQCHAADTTTSLNLLTLKRDLSDPANFRQWENIYDRIRTGDMPPKDASPPDAQHRSSALSTLKQQLLSANKTAKHGRGRVPARRLTRLEYEYTVRDLLGIDGEFQSLLPPESTTGSFDTVGAAQHFSALHLESYLTAADAVLDTAIRLHKPPYRSHAFDLIHNKHLNDFHDRDVSIGGNISRKIEDGVAIFRDVDYLLRSDLHGFRVRTSGSGMYRINISATAFQSDQPVALKLVVKDISGQTKLVGAWDLRPGQTQAFEVDAWLTRTKVFYAAMAEERSPALILADIYDAGSAKEYRGAGAAIQSIKVEGPLTGGWPPHSTRNLLSGMTLKQTTDETYSIDTTAAPLDDVKQIIANIAPRAFRRPLLAGELDAFVNLAKPSIDAEQDFVDVIKTPLRAILSSPQFLLLTGKPGQLDDYALASRLSYFLWKTLPDHELLALAERNQLSQPAVLHEQVKRLLRDARSERFLSDFCGQWLRLNEIDATTPDEKLYPEYDEILHRSILMETEAFLSELVREDLSISNLIDSDFLFLNRRLADHYDIHNITGQTIRRVPRPQDSPRGGILTQASVLKVTANGLVTSPVKRGAFVLSDLLGTPPPPPPDNVGSIEPDTTGSTSMRDLLQRHRNVETCAKCHREIDPPGFALESFDPIGGFRTHYRKSFDDILSFVHYKDGPEVDSSGVMGTGETFGGIKDFKQHLMKQQEQLARHFISQLLAYSTGGEIQFADRDEISAILQRTKQSNFAVRTIIHEVVQSEIFRNR